MERNRSLSPRKAVRRLVPAGLALSLLAGACTSPGDDTNAGDTTPSTDLSSGEISLTSGLLQTVPDCGGLLDRLVTEGLDRVGPYGFAGQYGGFDPRFGGIEMMEDEAMAMEESASDGADSSFVATSGDTDSGGEGSSFSGTNNQEIGVDEPDLVKTDGERLVTIQWNQLRVIAVGDGVPELSSTIELPENFWASELFLSGDTALVMSNGWTDTPLAASSEMDFIYPGGMPVTRIMEIDLAEGQIVRTFEFEGNYLSARDIDGTARIVLSAQSGQFPFVYPSNQGAEESAEKANRDIVENSTIEQWIPDYRILDSSGEIVDSGSIVECDRMHIPGEFSGFGTLALLTIDLNEGLSLSDSLAVLTDGQTIYASTDRLAVATARWPEWNPETGEVLEGADDFTTQIHTFDITDPERASYAASGSVTGHLLNQFSMSEHDGLLRVATTSTPPWGADELSESFVSILSEDEGTLETIGQVGGLGEGEQIFAVRFIGETAYVVTFRQVDPLYTVDLSEPTNPTVLGELKIPGFSTYLHPIDDGLILGIGQDATDDGRTTGAQVSAFDVSDLTDPTRSDQLGLGDNSYSPIDWDKKSFTYWAQTRTAYIPISWWNWDEENGSEDNGAAVVAVKVNEDGTLTELGRVVHPAVRSCEGPNGYTEELVIPGLPTTDTTENEEPLPENGSTEPVDAEESFVDDRKPIADPEPEEDSSGAPEPTDADSIVAPEPDDSADLVAPEEDEPYFPEEEYCWTYAAELRRTVVVGDQLLTISDSGVLASNLDDLSVIGWLSLEN